MTRVGSVNLGVTGLKVSRLGFGTFDFGVPSLHITPEVGGRILKESHKLGVSYWDTSDDYGSHAHVATALRLVPRGEVSISTKTNARDYEEARKNLQHSLAELGTDYVDIFLLHLVKYDSVHASRRLLRKLSDAKTTGVVKTIGVSTHSVKVVTEASRLEEVDVIMTICCGPGQDVIDRFPDHIPLEDGSMQEILDSIRLAHDGGKGVIVMKVLGTSAPPLVADYRSSIGSVAKLDFVDTILIGMRNLDQVRKNVRAILSGQPEASLRFRN